MTQFTCHGPCVVPTEKLSAGKGMSSAQFKEFWRQNEDFAACVGCYIFGMRAGKGITPIYVGKATKGFSQEIFTHQKLTKYLSALAKYQKGTPVMFFVVYPDGKKGVKNLKHIAALEKFLIQQAAIVNPLLTNIKHASIPSWGIAGVLRSATKKPTNGASAFKLLFGF